MMATDSSLFNRGIYLEEIGKHGDGQRVRISERQFNAMAKQGCKAVTVE
jgi:hypothetical protein